jgi:hypothetical protein
LAVAHAYFSGEKMMGTLRFAHPTDTAELSAFGGEADISQRLPTIAIYEYVF